MDPGGCLHTQIYDIMYSLIVIVFGMRFELECVPDPNPLVLQAIYLIVYTKLIIKPKQPAF